MEDRNGERIKATVFVLFPESFYTVALSTTEARWSMGKTLLLAFFIVPAVLSRRMEQAVNVIFDVTNKAAFAC